MGNLDCLREFGFVNKWNLGVGVMVLAGSEKVNEKKVDKCKAANGE
ncbi:hypothetical protein COLO4_04932 [Corchorus olitorius]|uniref:Uncharacterized protein n=2 Tax=Corchorus TaxID=93758 RepID=A0A1R3KSD0_9ROSI|nr:hypothetical protein COLO4_04932 [Corchorus olitorius]